MENEDSKAKSRNWLGTYYPTDQELDTFLTNEWLKKKFIEYKAKYLNG